MISNHDVIFPIMTSTAHAQARKNVRWRTLQVQRQLPLKADWLVHFCLVLALQICSCPKSSYCGPFLLVLLGQTIFCFCTGLPRKLTVYDVVLLCLSTFVVIRFFMSRDPDCYQHEMIIRMFSTLTHYCFAFVSNAKCVFVVSLVMKMGILSLAHFI